MLLGPFPLGLHPLGFIPGAAPPPPIVLPNGRWRPVFDSSYLHSLNPITDLVPGRFEVGFTLYFNTPNLPPVLTGVELVFMKPSGAQLIVPASQLTIGVNEIAGELMYQRRWLSYVFHPGDLDEPGLWRVYVRLRQGNVALSGLGSFPVL